MSGLRLLTSSRHRSTAHGFSFPFFSFCLFFQVDRHTFVDQMTSSVCHFCLLLSPSFATNGLRLPYHVPRRRFVPFLRVIVPLGLFQVDRHTFVDQMTSFVCHFVFLAS